MKKIIITIIAIMMLLSCVGCSKSDNVKQTKVTSEQFQQQMMDWFKEDITEDYLSYHFGVNDPTKYDLQKPEVTWGTLDEQQDDEELDARIALLKSWDVSELSKDEVITYKSLVSYYDLLKRDSEIEKDYGFLFTPNSGINNNLITNITEFEIREEQDAVDLITIVKDAPRFIDECIEYTKKQFNEDGICQLDEVIYDIVAQCQRFISKVEDNEIIVSFDAKLDKLGYEKNDEYKKEMADAVVNGIIPAYKRIIEMYDQIKGSGKAATMSKYGDEAKKSYEILFEYKSSSSIPVSEYRGILKQAIADRYKKLQTLARNYTDDYYDYAYGNYSYGVTNPYDVFTAIKGKMGRDFPEYPEVDYTINYLDPSVTSDNVAAYYVTAPVDNYNYNTVKANPNYALNDPTGFVPTLAHEGYPGHLYQHTYFVANHPNSEIRYNLNFMGYTEGWAMYVEGVANGYFGFSKNLVAMINIETELNYYLEAYLDILINYEGYGVSDIEKVLNDMGFNSGAAYDIYYTLAGDPCIMIPYALGLYNFNQLQAKTAKALGDKYSSVDYHKVILDAGPTSFDILSEVMDEYVASINK